MAHDPTPLIPNKLCQQYKKKNNTYMYLGNSNSTGSNKTQG